MRKRVGQILREAREAKKLSIKDVAEATNISFKYLSSLETEKYDNFPAPVFITGFLKSYSDFLNLDTAYLLSLYKGEQIDETEIPLDELTKTTREEPIIKLNAKFFLLFFSFFFFVSSSYLVYDILLKQNFDFNRLFTTKDVSQKQDVQVKKDSPISKIIFQNHFSKEGKTEYFILSEGQGINLYIDNNIYKVFFTSFENISQGDELIKVAKMGFSCCSKDDISYFRLKRGESKKLNSKTSPFSNLMYNFNFMLDIVTQTSIKIIVDVKRNENLKENTLLEAQNENIEVFLYFKKSSYVEFILDGKTTYRGIIQKNERRLLEATERLELKIGDGSAVEMIQNGNRSPRLSEAGKLVRKVFVKVPDPYDATKLTIQQE